jgi:hypothetical protein
MKKEGKDIPTNPEDQEQVSPVRNIGKMIFLVAVLVAAWFVLEWLMGSK